jgi:TonB-linked SusC/RagA family outer membrane protein
VILKRFISSTALAAACLAALATAPPLHAQESASITGTVTDTLSRQGIPGAQVIVAGTTRGAITNEQGNYRITGLTSGAHRVRVQRIGYAPGERVVNVSGGETVEANFALRAVPATLSGQVVVGYGTANRQDVSSATSHVGGEEVANTPLAGVDAALQGKAAGVQVVQNAGNPGNGISVRVRGPASLNAGNQPLYVVDGVPIIQDNLSQLGLGGQDVTAITGLNPDEIASIDILKDAASAAIYGSRGSNGVVLITTKRGQQGGARFTFNAYTGVQNVSKKLDMLNSQQYVEIFNESAANDEYDPEDYPFVVGEDDAINVDWQDAVFRSAPVRDMQLGVSGGTDRVQYFLSGSVFQQEGIVIGSAYDRISGRLNLDFSPTERLLFRTSLGLSREDNDRVEGDGSLDGVVTNALGMQPMRPVRREDGSYAGEDEDLRYSNPAAIGDLNTTQLLTYRGLGNLEAQFHATERVRLTGRLGFDVIGMDESQWEDPSIDDTYAASAGGVGKTGQTNATKFISEAFATFEPFTEQSRRLSLLAGASLEQSRRSLNFVRGEGFTSGFRRYVRNASNVTEFDGTETANNLVSFFSRANYALNDRYLFTASVRADGSSRFGEENRWGLFPAASVGWLLTEEPFAAGLAERMNMKLRLSYGQTGNQGIGDFAARALASGAPYAGIPGIAAGSIANTELGWETTRELDAGVDLDFFGGRVGIIADVYQRRTSNLLVSRPIPLISGYSSVWDNVGVIRNRGLDLSLETANVRPASTGGFGWTTTLNVTFNRNRVMELYQGESFTTGINGRQTSIVEEGSPLGSFYMLKFEGVDPATGNAIFRDVDGDGDITASDRMIVGDPHPDYFGGLTNAMTFRGFELRGFFQFSRGNDIFNMMRLFTDDGACTWDNKFTDVLRRWRQPGDITDVPRMSYDCASGADEISSRYIEDGSYIRLQELTLAYQLPAGIGGIGSMQGARVFVSGRNLATWTDYTGYNPDVNSAGSDENVIMGTDYYAYPLARTITFGVSASW